MVFEETITIECFWLSDHCHQWFFDGFLFFYHRFQWFSMVPDHWSNDAMVSMDRRGLYSDDDGDVVTMPRLIDDYDKQ